jgi:hypothetical protein
MLITQETPTNNEPLAPANLVIDTGKETKEEEDFLIGATCNPNNPEDCEACQ